MGGPHARKSTFGEVRVEEGLHGLAVCPSTQELLRAFRVLPGRDRIQAMADHRPNPTDKTGHLCHLHGDLLAVVDHLLYFFIRLDQDARQAERTGFRRPPQLQ